MGDTHKERRDYARTLRLARTEARMAAAQAEGAEAGTMAAQWLDEARVGAAVARLMARNVGWLRLVPDCDGRTWCKFRYTSGRWKDHYSLAVFNPAAGTLAETLEALEHKVMGALLQAPTHKPSPDRF